MSTGGAPLRDLVTPSAVAEALAYVAATTYVIGFLVVSAHLASLGVENFQVFRLQYIATGTVTLAILLMYAAFVGWELVRREDYVTLTRVTLLVGLGGIWARLAGIFVLSAIAFKVVVATLAVSAIFFDVPVGSIYYLLFVFFVLDVSAIAGRTRGRWDLISRLVTLLAMQVMAIPAFFRVIEDVPVRVLFWRFTLLAIAIGSLYYWRRILGRGRAYVAAGLAFVVLLWSVDFGSFLYKFVRPSIGGGKPVVVRLLVTDQARKMLKGLLLVDGYLSEEVFVLADSGGELVVRPVHLPASTQRVVRINKGMIQGSVAVH